MPNAMDSTQAAAASRDAHEIPNSPRRSTLRGVPLSSATQAIPRLDAPNLTNDGLDSLYPSPLP